MGVRSDFEREVFKRLVGMGYRVKPQVKVGPYSIDLVVEGVEDRRLAIELDGDQHHTPGSVGRRIFKTEDPRTCWMAFLKVLGLQFYIDA